MEWGELLVPNSTESEQGVRAVGFAKCKAFQKSGVWSVEVLQKTCIMWTLLTANC